jgi:PAS domain S-box-containing protein
MLQALREPTQDQLPKHASQAEDWTGPIVLAVVVGLTYFLAARLSLFLKTQPDGVAVFWPAAGVSAGILIALQRDVRWPIALGVTVATIVANLTSDRNIWSAVVFALCNVGEALLVAWFIDRYIVREFSLDSLRHVVALLAATIIATALSGIGGTAGYKLFHSPAVPFLITWQHWVASDTIGIITVAPLMIGLVAALRAPPPREELIEGGIAVVATATATGAVIFLLPATWREFVLPVELLLPLLLWLAARCRPVFTAAAVFVISLMIVCGITFGLGLFGQSVPPLELRILGAQAGILGVAICGLVLAALFAERRSHTAVLMESEDRMRTIVNTVVDGIITIDDKGAIETLNPAAARIFGYSQEEVIGRNFNMLMPEPFRNSDYIDVTNDLATGQAREIEQGIKVSGQRRDGSIFPMEFAVSEMVVAGRRRFTSVVRDITERKLAEEHQQLLIAELDHRVKNVLAQVAVVAKSSRQGSPSVDEFLRSLDGRIQSMATAHTLLSQSGWQGVGLDALVRKQLAPYASGTNITISGTDVILAAAEIQAVARVLHELATNAAKYGALSVPDGRVLVTWNRRPNGDATKLKFVWRELGGPPVAPKSQLGYGTTLIRDLIPHELGGTVDLVFASDGVSCRIEFPVYERELPAGDVGR